MKKNYLIGKKYQILSIVKDHINGGSDISAVFYKNHKLYLGCPEIGSLRKALKNDYKLLGAIQGKDYKEIKRQLKHMTQAL